MKADIIIGANLGDEGKGTVVATCAKHSNDKILNILTNGGAQRAHSILTEDGNFTFQHFGSGTYHGAYNYFSRFFILNPMQFVKEYEDLKKRGVIINNIYRDINCRFSTPFDMIANSIIEYLRGDKKHGSCGMGIWETTLRYNTIKSYTFEEFIHLSEKDQVKYLLDVKTYFETRRIMSSIPSEWKHIWTNTNLIYHFIDDCKYVYENTIVSGNLKNTLNEKFDHLIFENGQGLMLSDTGKDVAGTTPSLTGCDYAAQLINELNIEDININLHYVSRTYLTRHGRGYLNNENNRQYISSGINDDRTNHYNTFQEDFRYGELDNDTLCEMYNYIIKDSSKIKYNNLILDLTHCDEVDKEKEFKQLFKNVVTYDSPIIK